MEHPPPEPKQQLLSYVRFTLRLDKDQWARLRKLAKRDGNTIRGILDQAVQAVPLVPVGFQNFMRRAPYLRRRVGVQRLPKAVSMSVLTKRKLDLLAGMELTVTSPGGKELLNEAEREMDHAFYRTLRFKPADILRAAIENYFREYSQVGVNPRTALLAFCDKPLRVDRFPLELFGNGGRFKGLRETQPVLIDHSILLLATLQLAEPKPVDLFTPCSLECKALLGSTTTRQVLINPYHQFLYLRELQRLVRDQSEIWFGDQQLTPDKWLAAKAQELACLDLLVLPFRNSEAIPPDGAGHHATRLAIAAAKVYLGTDDFVFASVCEPNEKPLGVLVVRPGDVNLPKPKLELEQEFGV